MKKILTVNIIIVLVFLAISADAQELKNYNLYYQNPVLYNPAHARGDAFLTAYTNSHLQWISFDGAPKAYDLGMNVNFFPKMGAGFSISNTRQGLINNLYANLKYAYQLDFGKEHYLNMGVSLGIANDRLMVENAENIDMSDGNLSESYFNKTVFSSGAGIAYQNKGFDAQVIMPQLFEYKSANIYTIGIIGYKYDLNDSWGVRPSVMFRGAQGTPFQYDGNLAAIWNNTVWAQAGYRSSKSFIVSFGANISNYSIGYAYQADADPVSTGNSGSHEIQLIYKFIKDEGELKPTITKVYGKTYSKEDKKTITTKVTIYNNGEEIESFDTDPNSGYYLTELEPGKTYRFDVEAEDYETTSELVVLTENDFEKEKNFHLKKKTTLVKGNVKNADSKEKIKANVYVMEGNKLVDTLETVNGNYEIKLKPKTTYNFKVESEDFETITEEVKIGKEEQIDKDFNLNPVYKLQGIVTDQESGQPISAVVEIYNIKTDEVIGRTNSNPGTGKYSFEIKQKQNITVTARADKYLFYSENIDMNNTKTFDIQKNIQLKSVQIGASVILNNVKFDTGKSELRSESIPELNRLIQIMMIYPSIKVKISGHTDNVGTENYNKELSDARANAVVDYMVSKGIKKERLVPMGYGATMPLESNDTEEGKQKNRRVEAEILSE